VDLVGGPRLSARHKCYLNPTFADAEESEALTTLRDVTPERFSKLEKELVRGKGEVMSQVDIVFLL